MVGLAIGVIARMTEPKHRAVRRIEQGGAIQTLQGAPPQRALGGKRRLQPYLFPLSLWQGERAHRQHQGWTAPWREGEAAADAIHQLSI